MAIRILLMILAFALVVNLVLSGVSLASGVNLYKKYGKQIMIFFISFAILIVAIYIIFAFMGLI